MDPKTDPKTEPQTDPQTNSSTDDAETTYWSKFDTKLEEFFEKKMQSLRPTGTGRTEGRTTLPGFISDMFFGKPAAK